MTFLHTLLCDLQCNCRWAMPRPHQHLLQGLLGPGRLLHCPGVSLPQEKTQCAKICCSTVDWDASWAAPLSDWHVGKVSFLWHIGKVSHLIFHGGFCLPSFQFVLFVLLLNFRARCLIEILCWCVFPWNSTSITLNYNIMSLSLKILEEEIWINHGKELSFTMAE